MKWNWFAALPARADLALALLLFVTVAVLVVPLGPHVLDALIVISVAMGLLLLLIATRVRNQIELLTFPALLLVSTLYRLALNVASTKMVLIEGQAGAVIETVGHTVVGGNLLAGVCVFLIVALVQFMVVAKGAERVAEVAARFSLDAMPGKQMSIDAEQRAGTLSPEEARRRRDALDVESRLFGSMDGAMKFVKGDAIAGLVIALVNVFGGLASGVLYRGMSMTDALHHYTTLSIGDALVSQIPSLLVAIAAGLVITRVTSPASESRSLATHIAADLRRHPAVLLQVGAACLVLGAVPSMPTLVMVPIGVALMLGAAWIRRGDRRMARLAPALSDTPMPSFARSGSKHVPALVLREADAFDGGLVLQIAPPLLDALDAVRLDANIEAARERLRAAGHIGFPGLRIVRGAGSDAQARDIAVSVHGVAWCRFAWPEGGLRLLAFEPMRKPTNGMPGYERAAAGAVVEAVSIEALSLEAVLAGVVECACRQQAHRLVTMELVHDLMLLIRRDRPKLVEELAPSIPLPRLTELVAILVAEGLPLKRLPAVLDALLLLLPLESPIDEVAERLLVSLAPLRCGELAQGTLRVVALDDDAADALDPASVALSGAGTHAFAAVRSRLEALAESAPGSHTINLLCRPGVRAKFALLARDIDPRFRVFAHDGVPATAMIDVLETIEIASASHRTDLSDRRLDRTGTDQSGGVDPASAVVDIGGRLAGRRRTNERVARLAGRTR